MKIELGIIVITYNNKELLDRCLKSIINATKALKLKSSITVVDNASNDGTKELIGKYYNKNVRYIRNKKNYGLAKALNIGINANKNANYIMLLNDDVELFEDTIGKLIDRLYEYPDIYGIPARLIYPDGTPQRMKLKIVGVNKSIGENIKKVNFAGTTACMYRSDIFNIVGLFDEFYFFYNEDLDFSIRAKRKGIKFIFDPSIKVIHHRKKGRANAEQTIKPYFYATDYYFYRKNYGILFSTVYMLMALYHIRKYFKIYKKKSDNDRLEMLKKAREKLFQTIRNYRKIVKESV